MKKLLFKLTVIALLFFLMKYVSQELIDIILSIIPQSIYNMPILLLIFKILAYVMVLGIQVYVIIGIIIIFKSRIVLLKIIRFFKKF